ncbi:MAG: rhodanese-like domain-containing protein [candidate division NC10 bacterium]|jgi:rhodanese-related sulfurtransferase
MKEVGISRLRPHEVKERLDRGDSLIAVDVRKKSVYVRGHIPGALCLPITDLDDELDDLPAGKSFIFY